MKHWKWQNHMTRKSWGARLHFTQKLTRKVMLQILECLQIIDKKVPVQRKKIIVWGKVQKHQYVCTNSPHAKPYVVTQHVSDAWDVLFVLLADEKHGT